MKLFKISKYSKVIKKHYFLILLFSMLLYLSAKGDFRNVFRTLGKYLRWSLLQKFFKRPHLRCLTSFWIRLCNLVMLITFRGDWTVFLMWTLWPSHHLWNWIKLSPPIITSLQYGKVRKNIVNMLQWDILTLNKQ